MGELGAYDWFFIIYTTSTEFYNGDDVYLKCEPDVPMKVFEVTDQEVIVMWIDENEEMQFDAFLPECLIHHSNKEGICWKQEFKISLN